MKALDWLPAKSDERWGEKEEAVYSLDELRRDFETRDLGRGGWLVLKRELSAYSTIARENDDSAWFQFAVLEFAVSETNGANTMVKCVFHGEGPGGRDDALRECRHTYWGENGYIFYPDGVLIAAAFAALAEFFDDMADAAPSESAPR